MKATKIEEQIKRSLVNGVWVESQTEEQYGITDASGATVGSATVQPKYISIGISADIDTQNVGAALEALAESLTPTATDTTAATESGQ
jgi:hypothetical protein